MSRRTAKILYVGTYGSDDPTRASLPFILATGGFESGDQAQIVLLGEAVYLMHDDVLDQIQGIGFPPLRDVLPSLLEHNLPLFI